VLDGLLAGAGIEVLLAPLQSYFASDRVITSPRARAEAKPARLRVMVADLLQGPFLVEPLGMDRVPRLPALLGSRLDGTNDLGVQAAKYFLVIRAEGASDAEGERPLATWHEAVDRPFAGRSELSAAVQPRSVANGVQPERSYFLDYAQRVRARKVELVNSSGSGRACGCGSSHAWITSQPAS
jgi:hypothetical protein